jgi:hypothetical protein
LLTAGLACGPKISPEEMGEVVFEVPDISGADEPFPLPQLEGAESPKKTDGGEVEVEVTETPADSAPVAQAPVDPEKAGDDPTASGDEAPPTGDIQDPKPDVNKVPPAAGAAAPSE